MDFSTIATSSLVASFVTLLFGRGFEWQANGVKARAMLRGIELEINHAEGCATAYIRDSEATPWAPGYRIGVDFMRAGIPKAAGLGKLSGAEAAAIHTLYIAADEANRSLEWLAHHNANPPEIDVNNRAAAPQLFRPSPLDLETSRARLKFGHVLARIPAARKSVRDALARIDWYEKT